MCLPVSRWTIGLVVVVVVVVNNSCAIRPTLCSGVGCLLSRRLEEKFVFFQLELNETGLTFENNASSTSKFSIFGERRRAVFVQLSQDLVCNRIEQPRRATV